MKRLLLAFALVCLFSSLAQSQEGMIQLPPVLTNSLGQALAGINVAVCGQSTTTAAAVSNNVATYTIASTTGYAVGMTLHSSGFTGGDTYLNTSGAITALTSTTLSIALTHANASAGTNGTLYAVGSSTQACAPLSTLYTDNTGTVTTPNPFTSDGLGNVVGWAPAGMYELQSYGPTVTTTIQNFSISCSPNSSTSTCGVYLNGNNAWTGNETHSGTETFTGQVNCKNFENLFCVDAANTQSWSGTDVGGWFNSLYSGLPSRGGKSFLGPASNSLSLNFSTPITFNTSKKYPIVEGLAPAGGGDTANPGGATLNYTPTTATSAITLDWAQSPTADTNPGAGLRDFGLGNNNCNTFGGCASSAIGLDVGPTNGGAQFGLFHNLLVQGFSIGERINGGGQSWGMQHFNSIYKYNTTGVSITTAEETENWFGGTFLGNGQGVSASGTGKFFGTQFDSNTTGGFSCTGSAGTSGFSLSHFENLGGSGAPNYLGASGCNIQMFGGDALDDVTVGTTPTLLGTNTAALWLDGVALSSAGRTYTTGVVGVSGAAHLGFIVASAAGVGTPCPAFGTSSNCEVIDPNNLGGLGKAYFYTPDLGLQTTANPLHLKATNGSGGNTINLTALGNSTVTVPTGTFTMGQQATTYLKQGSGSGNYTGVNTASFANVDTTNLCQVVTIPTGWKLQIAISGDLGTNTAAVVATIAVADIGTTCGGAGVTALTQHKVTATAAATTEPFSLNWVIAGDGAAHAISLQALTSNGADAWLILNSPASLSPTMVLTLMPSS